MRKKTKKIQVGDLFIGGDAPISIQSMTTTYTEDVDKTVEQIKALLIAGCEIVRVAVPTLEAARAIREIKKQVSCPIVADIHFDYRLALAAIEAGVDKVRLNPGNIGSEERIKEVVEALKSKRIPVRIGVNSGSVEKDLLEKYGAPTPEAMVESALRHVRLVEKYGYDQIAISIKSSDVVNTVKAYRLLSEAVDYPLHVGVTEAGTLFQASIKSAMGIGSLLLDGIGDTIRVSVTGDPVQEIRVAKGILASAGVREFGLKIVSCPTCGRCHIGLETLVNEVEAALSHITAPVTIAIMGCAVNGPGEAREADFGIAGGIGEALLFKKGEIIKKIPQESVVDELKKEVESWIGELREL
ncbi:MULTISPECIES: flavodoxin-dependent (E)-4-hydroxy-3-methylbut-2-enyl-diphosphate synthase [unclassified Fusibacter]|uniref:flavodoxin-dependent (E)-4-hydroxy-3-methylbut-2-enyl-diphosphate synthase n=1 Tax=unclassified Fusibacter TaxID=2624464 RepID=UPI0010128F6A|nr:MULTISPECIES: flavodoxin-dependent (E)-4-hydroxy-3-methylbut-2-enyl-diphosphate synthase [unclassified Fusibacter]MCK8058797.1 flavodoxin-dependent (E)-4-hydroxy-3-methylbut-2-enyl-diphosphate synthase [Fusibacter sp. A2]NPE21871.1 flavodoxin-dependent (E)-4-hydroxy-3-methylbut-2-enyl-diphosphate synthase [Fusibacter sp. A1]RXV61443.1 flavodoxin-dependent (E)-4-hydroxy-3-methylbut-2-enyl-diphosphate synthase [Fusibacter sp. A1]